MDGRVMEVTHWQGLSFSSTEKALSKLNFKFNQTTSYEAAGAYSTLLDHASAP